MWRCSSPPRLIHLFALALGAEVIAASHAETVGDEIGQAEDDHHHAGKLGTHRSGDNGEGGDASVDAAEHCVGKVAMPAPSLDPLAYALLVVFGPEMLKLFLLAHGIAGSIRGSNLTVLLHGIPHPVENRVQPLQGGGKTG